MNDPVGRKLLYGGLVALCLSPLFSRAEEKIQLWPGGRAPGDTMQLGAEVDQSKAGEGLVAGKPIIRLANVSEPTISFFPAPAEKAVGTTVVICPGGAHRILAWDLEGTEVATWLNSIGVHAAVVKYRVPARSENPRYTAAVQDAQRAMSLVRSRATEWKLDPKRIGILGFSAGGETAALAALFRERTYIAVDDVDKASMLPDFAILIYPAYLVEKDGSKLLPHVKVNSQTPQMFFVHAFNDGVRPESSVLLWLELKKHNVPAEMHLFSQGGHGYGLRPTDKPCTLWPGACEQWLRVQGWLSIN